MGYYAFTKKINSCQIKKNFTAEEVNLANLFKCKVVHNGYLKVFQWKIKYCKRKKRF